MIVTVDLATPSGKFVSPSRVSIVSLRSTGAGGTVRRTPTVSEAMRQWLALREAQGLSPQTISNERSIVTRFAALTNDMQTGHLRPEHVTKFFYDPSVGLRKNHSWALITGREMRPGSFNKARANLAGFFAFCRDSGWVKADLMVHIRRDARSENEERLRLDLAQLIRLIECADCPRDRAMLAHAANTALRASEICWPRIKHVDLQTGSLRVWLIKTKESDVMVITRHLEREIRRWLAEYQRECGPLQPEWYLFPARLPGFSGGWCPTKPVRRAHEVVHKALGNAGFAELKGEGFHTIRRSVARLAFDSWADRGYDSALRMTQALLHHKSIEQTERYIGLTPDKQRRDREMRTGFIFDVPNNIRSIGLNQNEANGQTSVQRG
jgi:integrase